MEKMNKNALGLAVGFALAAIYLVCAAAVALLPRAAIDASMKLLFHNVKIELQGQVEPVSILLGTIGWFIIGTAFGYLVATAYNQAGRK